MPVPSTLGVALLIHASPHPCHCLSRHIGSSTEAAPNSDGELGKHTQPFLPARNCLGLSPALSGQSMMVAFLLISAGAALVALAIFCAVVIFEGACFPSPCCA